MGNRKELVSSLQELREDNIRKQKRGLHFIVASVFIWVAVLGIHISSLPILSKNLFTFCCSTPLVPLAFLLSKILKIDFQNKELIFKIKKIHFQDWGCLFHLIKCSIY